ncbi:hypothetical protein Goari_020675 [Gossypium aridum]|uniref:Uncharacterized protein n=1 Tax=Gossypium aridum TaxID=34290 RepID=A0A7J8YRA9_GOSAI|nr:hypothetical protein [Gossypium aridum]
MSTWSIFLNKLNFLRR